MRYTALGIGTGENMGIIKAISSKGRVSNIIKYVTQDKKTSKHLVGSKNCQGYSAKEEMQATKKFYKKEDGLTYKHCIVSFAKDENITPIQAHKMAMLLIDKVSAFAGHEILVATHTDREHIHSHVIINSVNMESGKKLRFWKKDLQAMKDMHDRLCVANGFSVTQTAKTFKGEERKEVSAFDKNTYNILKKADNKTAASYIWDIGVAVAVAKSKATSKAEFIAMLKEKGIETTWTDKRKHITFTDMKRKTNGEKKCSVRGNTLSNYFNMEIEREELEDEFIRRCERNRERGIGNGTREKAPTGKGRGRDSKWNGTNGPGTDGHVTTIGTNEREQEIIKRCIEFEEQEREIRERLEKEYGRKRTTEFTL